MTKTTALSIIAVFWLLSIICGGVAGFFLYPHVYPCNSNVGSVIVSVTDSFAPNKDTVANVWDAKPNKVGVKKYRTSTINAQVDSNCKEIFDSSVIRKIDITYCLDTNIYKNDTLSVDNFRATSTAYVTNNELIKLQVEWINLKPELWKIKRETVTVEKKQSLIKVFPEVYARAAFNAVTATGGGAGGGASFVIKDMHLIGIDAGANKSIGQPIDGEVLLRYGVKLQLKK